MPILGLEPTLDATLATLREKLPAAIADVNATWTDEPQLESLADDAYYPGGYSIIKYPSVEVALADFTLDRFSLQQVDASLHTPLIVRGWVQDAKTDVGRLYRRTLRFSTAILRVLAEPGAFGENAQLARDTTIRGAFRFNPESDERPEVEASCLLVFYLDAVEGRF